MNARESKFIALVHLYEKTLLKNEGMNPSDYHFWLHKRSRRGSSRDWLIIKHQYTSP